MMMKRLRLFALIFVLTMFVKETSGRAEDKDQKLKQGAFVILKVGPGINELLVMNVVEGLNERGCPTTVVKAGRPRNVTVSTQGETSFFKDPDSAAVWALERCLNR